MAADIEICAIILAAGFSSRMGRDKALLPWPPGSPDTTLLSTAITALRPFAKTTIVVAGDNALALTPIAVSLGAELIRNSNPEQGQFSSLQIGLRVAIDRGHIAAMISPVDCPPPSHASLRNLCAAFTQAVAHGAWAVAPEHNGRRGHPLIAGYPLMQAFLEAPVTSNAREVKHSHIDKFRYLAVPDLFSTLDLNTPEQYEYASKLT